MSSKSTHTSLRGDHSNTTTGTSSDRTITSSSKFASVISVTPDGVDSARSASVLAAAFCWARCLMPERSTAPAMAGPSGVADASRRQVCHAAAVIDPPGGADPAAGADIPRSVGMTKITLAATDPQPLSGPQYQCVALPASPAQCGNPDARSPACQLQRRM